MPSVRQAGGCYYCTVLMWIDDGVSFARKHELSSRVARWLRCTAEHLLARRDGGRDSRDNIVAACLVCNLRRHRGRTKAPTPRRIPNASETPARTRALALSAGAPARIDQPAGVNQHDHSLISMQSRGPCHQCIPKISPPVRSERTSLSPRGTRAAGPWGRPWPPPECAPRGHSGQRRARVDPPPPRRADSRVPGFQFARSPPAPRREPARPTRFPIVRWSADFRPRGRR